MGLSLVGGRIAVQTFYIISGFYMALILSEKYVGKNGRYSLFLSNRLLRLYPVYWVVLIGTIALFFFLGWYTDGAYGTKLDLYREYLGKMGIGEFLFLLVSNVVLFFQDAVMFFGVNPETGGLYFTRNFLSAEPGLYEFLFLPQAWTLGIELLFYVIAPFIIRRKTWVILIIAGLSLGLRGYLYFGLDLNHDPWTHRFFPTELFFFLLGILGYRMHKALKGWEHSKRVGEIALGLILLLTVIFSLISWSGFQYVYFLLFFLGLPFIFERTKRWKWDRTIGELSYPVYICHLLILEAILALALPQPGGLGLVLTVLSVVAAIVLNRLIAMPIERIRQKRVSQRATAG